MCCPIVIYLARARQQRLCRQHGQSGPSSDSHSSGALDSAVMRYVRGEEGCCTALRGVQYLELNK